MNFKIDVNPESEPGSERYCARCGAEFRCGAIAGEATCWCAALPPLTIDHSLVGCLCPACLKAALGVQQSGPASG